MSLLVPSKAENVATHLGVMAVILCYYAECVIFKANCVKLDEGRVDPCCLWWKCSSNNL